MTTTAYVNQNDYNNPNIPYRVYPDKTNIPNPIRIQITPVQITHNDYAKRLQKGAKFGFIHTIAYHYELGKAPLGTTIYPTNTSCEENEPYAKRYGITPIEINQCTS